MGMFKFFKNLGSPERTRESIRISYQKHADGAVRKREKEPHAVGLFGALAVRHRLLGRPQTEVATWLELAPFLEMPKEGAIEALAEYVVYLETPEHARIAWLQAVFEQSVRQANEHRPSIELALAHGVPWTKFIKP